MLPASVCRHRGHAGGTPFNKVASTEGYGAKVILAGDM